MNYEDYSTRIAEAIRERLGDGYKVCFREVTKNNGVTKRGLSILEEGHSVAPIFYIDEVYEQFGDDLNEAVDWIISCHCQEPPMEICLERILDFDTIKNRIFYRIVNRKENEDLLKGIPFREFLDLAVEFLVYIGADNQTSGVVLVTQKHQEIWGVTTEELFSLAKENTPRLFPLKLERLSDALVKMGMPAEICMGEYDMPMYILTNESGHHGAGCLLYDEEMEKIEQKIGAFYVIPSSIMETLLIPASEVMDESVLNGMVRDVNEQCLAREDILSDHVYFYTKTEGLRSCA